MSAIETIYIEREIADHDRVRSITQRLPKARQVICERYGEVFNPKSQNFRLQKQQPALILARKHDNHVLETPNGYGIGGDNNYYFSHMMNCVYDCRYCFLQGMYRSANYVLFVNYEDFTEKLLDISRQHKSPWFFSGYDCDSLALEPISGFAEYFLDVFEAIPVANLEIRTKSTQIRALKNRHPLENVVVAYSFTPERISNALEHKIPKLSKRIQAIQELQQIGWKIGLRFDPMIYCEDYRHQYHELFNQLFSTLDAGTLHSISFGPFRMPKQFHQNIVHLYPDEPLFAGRLEEHGGMISYPTEWEQELSDFCNEEILRYVSREQLFPCSVTI